MRSIQYGRSGSICIGRVSSLNLEVREALSGNSGLNEKLTSLVSLSGLVVLRCIVAK